MVTLSTVLRGESWQCCGTKQGWEQNKENLGIQYAKQFLQSIELQIQLSVILSKESVWIIQYTFISQATKDQFTEAKKSSFSLKNFNYHLPNLSGFTKLSKEKKKI